ncbi:TetR-like C-terminal domain-containing protein [Micromonospora sp. NPDC049679]|uniref:TetR-like C-terminal domain-containing protein n=1 Tax=Micromonospora sp. NPDC049679 TaxID=3155920 RepID=UPI00340263B9
MPRAGLTPQRVVAEAAAVADEVGLDRLTLAAVAQRLGVSLPGLYKHVRGLDGLQRDLALLGVRELAAAMSAAGVGRAGRDALHAIAAAYRSYAKRCPGRYAASVRAPSADDGEHIAASEAVVGVAAAVLRAYGIAGADAVDAIRSLRAALHGFVTLETAGGFGLPQSVDATFTRLVDALDTAFTSWATASPRLR